MTLITAAFLVASGVVAAVTVSNRSSSSPLDRAQAIANDADRFATARGSAQSLLDISALLHEEAEDCAAGEERAEGPPCQALFSGAGFAQVAGVAVLPCGRPELFDTRAAIKAYLDALETDATTARLPELPVCR